MVSSWNNLLIYTTDRKRHGNRSSHDPDHRQLCAKYDTQFYPRTESPSAAYSADIPADILNCQPVVNSKSWQRVMYIVSTISNCRPFQKVGPGSVQAAGALTSKSAARRRRRHLLNIISTVKTAREDIFCGEVIISPLFTHTFALLLFASQIQQSKAEGDSVRGWNWVSYFARNCLWSGSCDDLFPCLFLSMV